MSTTIRKYLKEKKNRLYIFICHLNKVKKFIENNIMYYFKNYKDFFLIIKQIELRF